MASDKLIPISDEQAKLGQEALKTLQGLGGFLKDTFGTLPQDVVGLLGGDYLKVKRAENLFRTFEKAKKRLEENHVEKPDASPSLAIPIIVAAADESRDELQEIWAALLAAAADPSRNKAFRLKFIEIAKKLDPLDVGLLREVHANGGTVGPAAIGSTVSKFSVSNDEVQISIRNLTELGLFESPAGTVIIFPLGREFLRAVR
jgi:hypothetical protein